MTTLLLPLAALLAFGAFLTYGRAFRAMRARKRHKRLMRSGREAAAIVLSISQAGLYRKKEPLIRLEVQVQPPGERSFVAEVTHQLDYSQLHRFRSGRSIRVKYIRSGQKHVALVYPEA